MRRTLESFPGSARLCAILLFVFTALCAIFVPPYGPWARLSSMPILSPQGSGFESARTFNPVVVTVHGKFVMLYRAQDAKGTCSPGYARCGDGSHSALRPEPIMAG